MATCSNFSTSRMQTRCLRSRRRHLAASQATKFFASHLSVLILSTCTVLAVTRRACCCVLWACAERDVSVCMCRSPYGLWTIFLSPSMFDPTVTIETIVLQLNVEFQVVGAPPTPNDLVVFGGPDHAYPFTQPCSKR